MTRRDVSAAIEWARKTRATRLDLQAQRLTELPDTIGELGELQHLDLTDNGLLALPDSIGKLAHLQTLTLTNNRLNA
ncbi:MAG: hypothetical protein ACRD8O_00380, partial [Bryobacteraceae bacterium]